MRWLFLDGARLGLFDSASFGTEELDDSDSSSVTVKMLQSQSASSNGTMPEGAAAEEDEAAMAQLQLVHREDCNGAAESDNANEHMSKLRSPTCTAIQIQEK